MVSAKNLGFSIGFRYSVVLSLHSHHECHHITTLFGKIAAVHCHTLGC